MIVKANEISDKMQDCEKGNERGERILGRKR